MLAEPLIAAKATLMRRLLALLFLSLALAPAACRPQPEGAIKAVVIGDRPQLRDPALGPLSATDSVLIQNVAQGLVQLDASGNIVPGLAERWNVSDDGLSYIFRIAATKWPNGRDITADQVVRVLKRYLAARSKDQLKDSLGSVEDIVAMTDRVIEIRLIAPRPNLLPLLAQPEFAILRAGQGTGPFKLDGQQDGAWKLAREIVSPDEDVKHRDEVRLSNASAAEAISAFAQAKSDLVLGGTFADLPLVQRVKLPRNALHFDPASGLFGLVPVKTPVKTGSGALADADLRKLLSQAIDRDALVAALGVPNLAPRTTLLEPGLDGTPPFSAPDWTATPLPQRLPGLKEQANRMFGNASSRNIALILPEGPGADLLFRQLQRDWAAIGFTVERAPAPSIATFALIDEVAPSSSPAWFVRRFRCAAALACDDDADKLMESARSTPVPAQRYALLAEAAGMLDSAQLFIPLTAPIRWSLTSRRIQNFAGNRYARHTLTDLDRKPGSGD
jgi:peptide/nickel transport system substrate-binding protein